MRKILGLLALCALMTGTTSLAQSRQYAGVSFGNPTLQGYYSLGQSPFFEDTDLRLRLALNALFGFGFNIGADVLFDGGPINDEGDLNLYYGFGPGLGYYGAGGVSLITLDATGLGGLKYTLNEDLELFGEAGLGLGFGLVTANSGVGSAGGIYPAIRLGLGVNFFL